MGKMKVHELAKELDVNAKDLLEEIKSLGYDVKSHLSIIDDDIISAVKKSNVSSKAEKVKDGVKEEKNMTTKKEKNVNPIIIRREVQVVNQEHKEIKKEFQKREEIGVVKRKTERDYNIINRNKQKTQVGSIADLFKKPASSQAEPNEKIEKEFSSKRVNTYAILEKQRDRQYNNNSNKPNNSVPSDNKKNNKDNNVRPYKTNAQQKTEYNKPNKPKFDKPYDNKNKPNSTGRKVDKDTKNVTTQVFNAEPHKDYRMNKKPVQQNDETKRNANRFNKHTTNNDLDMDKLKDLKSQNSLSGLFNDSEGGMLDYYDVSNHRKNKKAFNKKHKELNKKRFEKNKIFELKEITIPESISVKDLAEIIKKTSAEVIKKLFSLGIMSTINQELDFDTAFLVAQEFSINATKQVVVTDEEILFDETEDTQEDLLSRAPIVVVMGHVDHGKTSLLDVIRSTNVSEKEAGGITQHIGAYKVNVNGRDITFLDTPGHEAFTSMRARGAQITDIVILVVAADDGIMPQTVEAINHAKAANVPIIVAINKMDKQGANLQKIKQSLLDYELVPEEYGGKTICVPISAKNHQGINDLLEMVLLEADMLDLRSNPNKQAKGTVIESRLDKNKGTVTTLLVQRGTLDIGDTIVLGNNIGKIRAMVDDKGKNIEHAGPSTPVEIIGLPEVSVGGDIFYEVENEKVAKHLIEQRRIRQREKDLKTNNIVTVEDLFNKMESDSIKELNLIVKADVNGSLEALKDSLLKLSTSDVKVSIVHGAVGPVNMSDATLAKVANALIIAFNVRIDVDAKNIIATDKIQVKTYSVIYDAINDIKSAMKGMLEPTYIEDVTGLAEVRNTFKVSNIGTVAGSYVLNGKIVRNGLVRLIRDGVVIYSGKIASLKRFKDDVKEAAASYECGIQIEGYNDIKELDQIECYIMKEVKDEE